MRTLALLVLGLTAHATTLSQITLGKLVTAAESIVVAKVTQVVRVPAGPQENAPGMKIAEAEVSLWLKGPVRPRRIWYLADAQHSADYSQANVGETAVLFLADPRGHFRGHGENAERCFAAANFWKGVKKTTGGAPLLKIFQAGVGRLPVRKIAGDDYAEISGFLARLPVELRTAPVFDPGLSDIDRLVALNDLIAFTKHRLTPVKAPDGKLARVVFELLDELDQSVDPSPGEQAHEMIQELGEKALPVLWPMLDDPACPRRETVAEAISFLDAEALFEGLKSKDVKRRRGCAYALAWAFYLRLEIHPDDHEEKIVEALARPEEDLAVRRGLLTMLMGLTAPELVAPLIDSMKDDALRGTALRTIAWGRQQFARMEEDYPELLPQVEAALLPHAQAERRRGAARGVGALVVRGEREVQGGGARGEP